MHDGTIVGTETVDGMLLLGTNVQRVGGIELTWMKMVVDGIFDVGKCGGTVKMLFGIETDDGITETGTAIMVGGITLVGTGVTTTVNVDGMRVSIVFGMVVNLKVICVTVDGKAAIGIAIDEWVLTDDGCLHDESGTVTVDGTVDTGG